jgi:hypothetical protein
VVSKGIAHNQPPVPSYLAASAQLAAPKRQITSFSKKGDDFRASYGAQPPRRPSPLRSHFVAPYPPKTPRRRESLRGAAGSSAEYERRAGFCICSALSISLTYSIFHFVIAKTNSSAPQMQKGTVYTVPRSENGKAQAAACAGALCKPFVMCNWLANFG